MVSKELQIHYLCGRKYQSYPSYKKWVATGLNPMVLSFADKRERKAGDKSAQELMESAIKHFEEIAEYEAALSALEPILLEVMYAGEKQRHFAETFGPIDWDFWGAMPTALPWQLCALSLHIDPDRIAHKIDAWQRTTNQSAIFDGSGLWDDETNTMFAKRARLLIANLTNQDYFTPCVLPIYQNAQQIKLSEFAFWALSLGWKELPSELIALAKPRLSQGSQHSDSALQRAMERFGPKSPATETASKPKPEPSLSGIIAYHATSILKQAIEDMPNRLTEVAPEPQRHSSPDEEKESSRRGADQWEATAWAEHQRRMAEPTYKKKSQPNKAQILADFCEANKILNAWGNAVSKDSVLKLFTKKAKESKGR